MVRGSSWLTFPIRKKCINESLKIAPHSIYNSIETTLAIASYSRIATINKFLCYIEFCNVLGTFTVGMMRGWRDQICQ